MSETQKIINMFINNGYYLNILHERGKVTVEVYLEEDDSLVIMKSASTEIEAIEASYLNIFKPGKEEPEAPKDYYEEIAPGLFKDENGKMFVSIDKKYIDFDKIGIAINKIKDDVIEQEKIKNALFAVEQTTSVLKRKALNLFNKFKGDS